MKTKILLIGILVLAIAGLSFTAIKGHDPAARAAKHAEKIIEKLNLDEEKATQVRALFQEAAEEMKALHEQADGDFESMRESMHQVRESKKAKMAEILTPEQMAQLETLHRQHRSKMAGHMRKEILPILAEKRRGFEALLSADEKATIEEVRANVKAAMEEAGIDVAALHRGDARPDREQMHAMREIMKPLVEPLRTIAMNHRDDLKAIREEVKPKIERKMGMDAKGMHPGHGEAGEHHRHGRKGHHGHMAVKFLLMDPDRLPADATVAPDPRRMSAYPNPATDFSTLSYEVKTAGQVTVELLNKDGQVVRVLDNRTLEAGGHQVRVETNDLANGEVYFYRVTDGSGTATKKFIVVK